MTSQIADIIISRPLDGTVETLLQRTKVIIAVVADPRLVTPSTAVSTVPPNSLEETRPLLSMKPASQYKTKSSEGEAVYTVRVASSRSFCRLRYDHPARTRTAIRVYHQQRIIKF